MNHQGNWHPRHDSTHDIGGKAMKARTVAALALASALLSPALGAQGLGLSRGAVVPSGPGKQPIRLMLLLDIECPVPELSQSTGCIPLDSNVVGNMYLVESSQSLAPPAVPGFIAAVAAFPGVISVEPVQVIGLPESESCGQPASVSAQQCTVAFADGTPSAGEFTAQQALDTVHIANAQKLSKHHPNTVAVIDTGVDPLHPALAGHVADTGWDFVAGTAGGWDVLDGKDNDGDGLADEAHGHGTHIASLVLLVNPDARIMPLRVLDADGNGDSWDVADAIFHAVDYGADIINLSLSMKEPSNAVAMALEFARFMGVSVFVSAGNTGNDKLNFPANYDPRNFDLEVPFLPVGWKESADTVTVVGATMSGSIKADFSSYGWFVDVVAPGVDIYGAMPGGGYAWWSGTSMATGVASGVASLVLSVAGPTLNMLAAHVVKTTADSIDQFNPDYYGDLGEGRVDAWDAAWKAKVSSN
ncbi:MAG: hypothetical protein FJ296_06025 [Planctomycetes bacterium]|nr:hypothetical protein [Planctomycetota bacterium]